MDVRKIALLVGALLVAAVTAVMARSLFSGAETPAQAAAVGAPQPDGPQVLVATRALPVGTILQADSFRYQPWPKELVQEAYYIKGDVTPPQPGTVVRYAITAGQPITQGALVKPGDSGFLAAALGPGMRAVTVPVSAQSGVAGFIFPGDRVDLVLTQEVAGNSGPPLRASETFVRNIRVLATDQRTDNEIKDGKSEVKTFSTVTLEATPRIAEKIAVAQAMGQLSLSLRSIADNNAELERAIAAGEVSVDESKDPKAERQMLLQVASRPVDTDTTFVTGGDVSRFARRTMPSTNPVSAGPVAASPSGEPAAAFSGPVVKIARGNAETVVPVRGK
ncbi:Flp pilus assembly protein CpaB [Sphingomonas sp.]|uniref:Flp pilus assembly protein CpaB n=1 Tax=Sphingomonas sp. TaxID=28214 RepID=UPI002DBCD559|nr:Flp pilus assembly protein CpaB [Sphingomonas sp.]HEU4969904.1 Flp pilus assembly protein CpaB [Sphingomonas sp.]